MGYINSVADMHVSFEISCSRSKLIELIGSIGYLLLYSNCTLDSDHILRSGYEDSIKLLCSFEKELQEVLDSVNESLCEF